MALLHLISNDRFLGPTSDFNDTTNANQETDHFFINEENGQITNSYFIPLRSQWTLLSCEDESYRLRHEYLFLYMNKIQVFFQSSSVEITYEVFSFLIPNLRIKDILQFAINDMERVQEYRNFIPDLPKKGLQSPESVYCPHATEMEYRLKILQEYRNSTDYEVFKKGPEWTIEEFEYMQICE